MRLFGVRVSARSTAAARSSRGTAVLVTFRAGSTTPFNVAKGTLPRRFPLRDESESRQGFSVQRC